MEYIECAVEFTFDARDAEGMTLEEFVGIPFKMGKEMADKQVKGVFETLQKPTPHSRAVTWEIGQLTFDVLLEVWSEMEINFGDDGLPEWPTMVLSPEAHAEVQEKLPVWHEDLECRRRWEEVVEKKRKQFHEREARRRLVD